MRGYFLNTFLLLIALFLGHSIVAQDQVNKRVAFSADLFAFSLPLAGGSMSLFEEDWSGTEQAVFSFGSTYVSALFLKRIINQERPNGDAYGFPSGHTAMAFSGATYIQERYGWQYGLPAYLLAGYVGWTRIYLKEHNVKQVFGGAFLGYFLSRYFTTPYGKEGLKYSFLVGKKRAFLQVSLRF